MEDLEVKPTRKNHSGISHNKERRAHTLCARKAPATLESLSRELAKLRAQVGDLSKKPSA